MLIIHSWDIRMKSGSLCEMHGRRRWITIQYLVETRQVNNAITDDKVLHALYNDKFSKLEVNCADCIMIQEKENSVINLEDEQNNVKSRLEDVNFELDALVEKREKLATIDRTLHHLSTLLEPGQGYTAHGITVKDLEHA